MKQIVLAHPFERLSGQVTREKQDLVYNDNRNPLWNAPVGKQAALNFKPQMVVSYNSKTGKQSFRIQTHASADNTEPARLRMALFGATVACVSAAMHNPTLLSNLYDAYKTVQDQYKSFRSWLSIWMRVGLSNKSATITIGQGVNIKNPWVAGGTGTDLTISDEVLLKFAPYLCPASCVVDGKIAASVPSANMPFSTFENSAFNNGDFTMDEDTVLYQGHTLYREDGEEIAMSSDKVAGTYTLIPANA